MTRFSTRQAAKKLGMAVSTLSRYISEGKVPAPRIVTIGELQVHSWTERDIERVREILPKIANGRKTRYIRQRKKQAEKLNP
jgi:predicted DNA-binding transcriptional regulator AlpA